ncbi:MAG TPA: hypothetical protein VFJ58_07190 [Armatimonadota bacterium]|nr:hypothetical protein [Armatimonadota bacterium]
MFVSLIVAMGMCVGLVAIVMGAVVEMQKRTLAHRERMRELELEHLRLEAGANQYLPSPSDTLIRRGSEER